MDKVITWFRRHRVIVLIAGSVVLAGLAFMAQSEAENVPDLLVQPKRGPFRATVTTSGELKALNSVSIYGPANAMQQGLYQIRIDKLVAEGTVVKKGDFVAELDRSELSTKMQALQVELEKAQSQHEQTALDTLLTLSQARDEIVNLQYAMEEAKLAFEQARYEAPSVQRQAAITHERAERRYHQSVTNYATQVRQSAARMREVEATLSKARNDFQNLMKLAAAFTVHAPENGMVIYRRMYDGKLQEGGSFRSYDPVVAELPDLTKMQTVTYVNEVDIQRVRTGQVVEIGLDAAPEKKLTGTVTAVANIGEQRPNSDSKVFQVVVMVNDADTTLRPSMTTSNSIVVAEFDDALTIPLETVQAQDSLTYVYTRRGGRLVRQEVILGLMNENDIVVEAGVQEDDQLYLTLPADTAGLPLERVENGDVVATTAEPAS